MAKETVATLSVRCKLLEDRVERMEEMIAELRSRLTTTRRVWKEKSITDAIGKIRDRYGPDPEISEGFRMLEDEYRKLDT